MNTHTPTPWRYTPGRIGGIAIIADDNLNAREIFIAALHFGEAHNVPDSEAQQANAAFIVTAVNNHDALVADSKRLDWLEHDSAAKVRVTGSGIKVAGVSEWQPSLRVAIDVARAADIANAFKVEKDARQLATALIGVMAAFKDCVGAETWSEFEHNNLAVIQAQALLK